MKISVIDIGSNSVRLMLWADGNTLYKKICTTRLGEGLSLTGKLNEEAVSRTLQAVVKYYREAEYEGAKQILAFATAAARRAENGKILVDRIFQACGLNVEILSGETEAAVGYLGALEGKDGGVLDIGGASTEITAGKAGHIIYARSLDIGTVRLKDLCGENKQKLTEVINKKITAFENVPDCALTAIGGTATTLVALHKKMKIYDAEKVHGTLLTRDNIFYLADRLLSATQNERLSMDGMEKGRADVIGGGALLMGLILDKLDVQTITVSEKDNLEGYLYMKNLQGEL